MGGGGVGVADAGMEEGAAGELLRFTATLTAFLAKSEVRCPGDFCL